MKKIIRYSLKTIFIVILIVLCIVLIFNTTRIIRERDTANESAPETGRFIQTSDNLNVFVQEYGIENKETVILVHGTGTWSEIWKDTSSVISDKGYHIVSIDLPPFGYSSKPKDSSSYSREKQAQRILDVINNISDDKVVIVGHSVGARPVLEAVLMSPQNFSKMVLVDPALGFDPKKPQFKQNEASLIKKIFFSVKPLRNAVISTYGTNPLFIERLIKSFVSKKESVTKERVKIVQTPLSVKYTTRGYADWLENLVVNEDTSLGSNLSNLEKINIPVSIIWGETDTVTPLWQGKEINKLIKDSTLSIIPSVGHIPYIEDTETFNKILIDFLEK